MRVHFTANGWEDYLSWSSDEKIREKLNKLIQEIRRTPYAGTGKPEPLKRPFAGWWSRRITVEHRLIYSVEGVADEQYVIIRNCRYHYE